MITYKIKNINKTINPGSLKNPIKTTDKILNGIDKPTNCPIKLNNIIVATPITIDLIIYLIVFFIIKSPYNHMVFYILIFPATF
jgi:hypothetical protein